jgi:hypothetical protein
MQVCPLSYYLWPNYSSECPALFPNPVYVISSMSHPQLRNYYVNTCMFILPLSCYQKAGRRAKHYEAAVSITGKLISSLFFFILLSLFLNATPICFKYPALPKFQIMYEIGHVF